MERCLDCEQLGTECICAALDSFFAEGREAERKANKGPYTMVSEEGTIRNYIVVATKLVGVACLLMAFGCAQPRCNVAETLYGVSMSCQGVK